MILDLIAISLLSWQLMTTLLHWIHTIIFNAISRPILPHAFALLFNKAQATYKRLLNVMHQVP
jgi:hypothetical protein